MTTTRTAIYVRISRDAEGTGLGVARQRADCEALAKRLGWTVADVYSDNDTSATSGKPRPEYERMMRDARAGKIDAVVVWDVDRLTRTPRELEDVIDAADKAGLRLASVGGDIDLGTEQGRMMARMKGTVARYEVEQSSRRLKSKKAELAAAGRYNGPRPFGYDFAGKGADQRLVVNDPEAAIIRECVERVLRGEGLWRIRNDLNARGVTTATGGPWQTQTLRRMLLRWTHAGYREHQPRTKGKATGKAALHAGAWEPIVDRETHERVIATLTDPARKANNRGTAVRYLLTGIARCIACGGPLVGTAEFTYEVKGSLRKDGTRGPSKTRHYPRAYKCPHAGCHAVQRRMSNVDDLVETVVVGLLERDGVRVLGGNPAAVEQARARVASLESKLALAADQFTDDLITGDQLARITSRLRPQVQAERERLRRAMPAEGLEEYAGKGAREAWTAADVEARRRVLKVLADAIGMTITLDRVGPGNGAKFDPESVRFDFA